MTAAILVIVCILAMCTNASAGDEQLYGTWRLVNYQRTIVVTGETTNLLGDAPRGFITYGRDGRMLVLIVADQRPQPADIEKMTDQERAALFESLISYGGTYTFDGKTVKHHVDISWNQVWTGTTQVRNVSFEGRKLILSTNPQPHAIDGRVSISELVWEKVE